MNENIKAELWYQFGAGIDMLENSIRMCPENIWNDDSKFWYIAYHTLFFLDYYLTKDAAAFLPPEPFDLSEFDAEGGMPPRVYSKQELLDYIEHCRNKCSEVISGLSLENTSERFVNEYRNYSIFEILLYNMRHVQHHTAQLNLILRKKTNDAPDWVSRTKH